MGAYTVHSLYDAFRKLLEMLKRFRLRSDVRYLLVLWGLCQPLLARG